MTGKTGRKDMKTKKIKDNNIEIGIMRREERENEKENEKVFGDLNKIKTQAQMRSQLSCTLNCIV